MNDGVGVKDRLTGIHTRWVPGQAKPGNRQREHAERNSCPLIHHVPMSPSSFLSNGIQGSAGASILVFYHGS